MESIPIKGVDFSYVIENQLLIRQITRIIIPYFFFVNVPEYTEICRKF